MESKLTSLYEELGEKIVSMIPCEWQDIYYLGEVEKDKASWSSVFYFKESDDAKYIKSHYIPDIYDVSEDIYDELLEEASEILLQIYDCFIENLQNEWEQMIVHINANGQIAVEYEYDVISGNDRGPAEREVIWAYKTFGNIPKDGTYMKKVLDDFLAEHS